MTGQRDLPNPEHVANTLGCDVFELTPWWVLVLGPVHNPRQRGPADVAHATDLVARLGEGWGRPGHVMAPALTHPMPNPEAWPAAHALPGLVRRLERTGRPVPWWADLSGWVLVDTAGADHNMAHDPMALGRLGDHAPELMRWVTLWRGAYCGATLVALAAADERPAVVAQAAGVGVQLTRGGLAPVPGAG